MAAVTKILSPQIILLIALIASSGVVIVESRFTTHSFGGRHLIEQYAGFITTDAASAATGATHGATAGHTGTKWAVLVAGSNGYSNYRHQADICHAYQILKNGGLKDENIIVLMYDDIANAQENPKKGQIINRPGGEDVYKGVPKDYTGNAVTAKNLLAVILGDKKAVKGGNGKVVSSGPNDHIFIFYSDHGSPGLLSMPVGDDLYAKDFIDALKKKHALGTYKSMVLYIEACEAGSIFDGLLPAGMNILATTASNPSESSYATYCPDTDPTVPQEYQTCLGDLYSVSWMEDSDKQNRLKETIEKQYVVVKKRTISAKDYGSHVMMYGDTSISKELLDVYIGSNLNHGKHHTMEIEIEIESETSTQQHTPLVAVDQREADILYLRQKVRRAPEGTQQKLEAEKILNEALAHRKHVDRSVVEIGKHLFGAQKVQQIIQTVRPAGQPLVDDWDCLKALAGVYQARCGSLQSYGLKYMRAFANMCNVGIRKEQMDLAATLACTKTTN